MQKKRTKKKEKLLKKQASNLCKFEKSNYKLLIKIII